MTNFILHFLICNIFISIIIAFFLLSKHLLKNHLTNRMQYDLSFILIGLLTVPFIPVQSSLGESFLSWIERFKISPTTHVETIATSSTAPNAADAINWMNDFTQSVSKNTPTIAGIILYGIWIVGILTMLLLVTKSALRIKAIKNSSLPLQNVAVCRLYKCCLAEMNITKNLPLYSTAFLKSPIMVGLFRPRIYLPIHLISDYNATAIRFMLLHELQHYKHKDAIGNYLMNVIGILYWFNPFVWYALKEMRNDREVACDTSVLNMLHEVDYENYGTTLINFAEKISLAQFPFAAGISGNMKQMKRRIINIASYKKPSFWKYTTGFVAFLLIAAILLSLIPTLSTFASNEELYQWDRSSETITYVDYSTYFDEYNGSFVLYNLNADSWNIYNLKNATTRKSPDSTWKIYDALLGLEKGMITPEESLISWNKQNYPFEAWNKDQTLFSAMDSSVNWYFQKMDERIGASAVKDYLQMIGYGNETMSDDLTTYWLESSLKISPIEQVTLLKDIYYNTFHFKAENINAVKSSICLVSSEAGNLYGKTGTGRIDGKDINGWFVGYLNSEGNTYFFATNIGADANATGSTATKITMSILSDRNIWN